MGTAGSMVIRPSGALGVLASGALAVKDAAGECGVCCGSTHDGDCYTFNQGQCSAKTLPTLQRFTSAQMQWSASNADTPPLGPNYNLSNQSLGASGIGPVTLLCYNPGDGVNNDTQIVQQPPGGPLVYLQFALGHYLSQGQLTRSSWVPYVNLPGTEGVDSTYYMRIHCDQFNFYARWNLNNNAVQVSADILGELSIGRLRTALAGYSNVNAQATIAASIAWQGCVPTMTMNVSGSFSYALPANNETHAGSFSGQASATFTGLVT